MNLCILLTMDFFYFLHKNTQQLDINVNLLTHCLAVLFNRSVIYFPLCERVVSIPVYFERIVHGGLVWYNRSTTLLLTYLL